MRVVEYVDRQVQDPEGRIRVREDHLVHRTFVELVLESARGDEVVGAEVALAHDAEVQQDQDRDEQGGRQAAPPAHFGLGREGFLCVFRDGRAPPQQGERAGDQQQRAQRVHHQQVPAVGDERVHEHVGLAGVRAPAEGAGDAGQQRAEQAEATRDGRGDPAFLPEELRRIGLPHDAVQRQEAQHRQGELQHGQGHGHRPELVVHRGEVIEELRERHEMAAQCEQHGEHRARHDPPFLLAPEGEQAQHEQEDGDGAHVHRPGREGLRAPVERKVLREFLEVGLSRPLEQVVGLGVFRIDRPGGRAAVEIGDQQVGKFLPAVGPGRGVVEVEALGTRAAFGGLGAAAAHGVRRVFHRRQELGGVGGDARDTQDQQERRSGEEAAPEALLPDRYHQHDDVDQDQQREVVGDLRVVGLDLEAQRQAEQRRPEDGARQPTIFPGRGGSCLRSAVASRPCPGERLRGGTAAPGLPTTVDDSQSLVVGEDQRGEHPGQEGQGLHLRVVADLDDL